MSKIKYRCDKIFGDGYKDAVQVMTYEIFELGNTDILDYIFINYELDSDDYTFNENTVSENGLCARTLKYMEELEENGFVDDLSQEDKEQFVKDCLAAIGKETRANVSYVLWLAKKRMSSSTNTERIWI